LINSMTPSLGTVLVFAGEGRGGRLARPSRIAAGAKSFIAEFALKSVPKGDALSGWSRLRPPFLEQLGHALLAGGSLSDNQGIVWLAA